MSMKSWIKTLTLAFSCRRRRYLGQRATVLPYRPAARRTYHPVGGMIANSISSPAS